MVNEESKGRGREYEEEVFELQVMRLKRETQSEQDQRNNNDETNKYEPKEKYDLSLPFPAFPCSSLLFPPEFLPRKTGEGGGKRVSTINPSINHTPMDPNDVSFIVVFLALGCFGFCVLILEFDVFH